MTPTIFNIIYHVAYHGEVNALLVEEYFAQDEKYNRLHQINYIKFLADFLISLYVLNEHFDTICNKYLIHVYAFSALVYLNGIGLSFERIKCYKLKNLDCE